MNKNKILLLLVYLSLLVFPLALPLLAKEPTYEPGYLQDIQIQQSYRSSSIVGLTGGIGSGSSYNVFYPLVRVNGITYIGQTTSTLKDWIVGSPIKVRFNNKRTKMYLKRESGRDFGVEIVKKAKG